jgi:hypothetical protein
MVPSDPSGQRKTRPVISKVMTTSLRRAGTRAGINRDMLGLIMAPVPLAYRSRAVRALVMLHEERLRRFLVTWKSANAASVAMPRTTDPAYESLASLLRHVLGSARGYMVWMCEVLGLPDPEIRVPPEPAVLSQDPDSYLEHVLERWRSPLLDVGDERLETPEYPSRWKTRYCIDAMLEHAVMHPIRHAFQLDELLNGR